ncbi:hypothetical protein MKX08_003335 [Trichoderma sp. CBMAI-0020]|nr:hypothetical protein MKX08_003335 [Trichoderma sp. CBMAI-0020]
MPLTLLGHDFQDLVYAIIFAQALEFGLIEPHLCLANSSTSAARATAIGVAKDVPDMKTSSPFHFDVIEMPKVEKLGSSGSGFGLMPPSLPLPSLACTQITGEPRLAGYARGLLPPLLEAAANIVCRLNAGFGGNLGNVKIGRGCHLQHKPRYVGSVTDMIFVVARVWLCVGAIDESAAFLDAFTHGFFDYDVTFIDACVDYGYPYLLFPAVISPDGNW